ncbi:unnamed protein product, partial [Clonostachys rosea f. rosea IK726]
VIPSPSAHALGICLDSASGILNGYQRLHDLQSLDHGWRAVLNIFAAGATLIYSFWTSEQVRKNASAADMAKDLRTCSSLLTVGGEWWPSAKTGQRSFGLVRTSRCGNSTWTMGFKSSTPDCGFVVTWLAI